MERRPSRVMNDVTMDVEYGPIKVTLSRRGGRLFPPRRPRRGITLWFPDAGPVTFYGGENLTIKVPVNIRGDRGYGP